MKVAVVSAKSYDRQFLAAANQATGRPAAHELHFLEPRLTDETLAIANGYPAICAFVNDVLDGPILRHLHAGGLRHIALRCAGFNNVDLDVAEQLGIRVARVPAYSPFGVAEHTLALILTLNRKTHRAFNRVREGNFSLEGLLGFELRGKTAGVVGTGKIGAIVCRLLTAFGCKVLAVDQTPDPFLAAEGVQFVDLDTLFRKCDIISLHCPLTPQTHHLINAESIAKMKPGVMLINTGRGALVSAQAVTQGLKNGQIGYLGLDVYEEEADLFFEDLSGEVIQDDVFMRLVTFPNVIVTAHQAFFTQHALEEIARTTIANLSALERGEACANEVKGKKK